MQNGLKYLDLAKNTFDQVFSQWDDQCGGGVYWARNRNDEKQNRDACIFDGFWNK